MPPRLRINGRAGAALTAVLFLAALACSTGGSIELDIANNTPVNLCYRTGAHRPDFCGTLQASGTTTWRPECSGGDDLTVIITHPADGRELYRGSATCDQWEISGALVVVDIRNGQIAVTDPFGGAPQ